MLSMCRGGQGKVSRDVANRRSNYAIEHELASCPASYHVKLSISDGANLSTNGYNRTGRSAWPTLQVSWLPEAMLCGGTEDA